MKRREFLETCLKGGTLLSVSTAFGGSLIGCSGTQGLPRRPLATTGHELSVIGFGGIMLNNMEQQRANDLIAEAFDAGVNYYDVAPTYGNAEERMGPALEPYRDRSFLACKTTKRDKDGAQEELEASLNKLRTDHFDLYQLHALSSIEDVEQAFGPDGAMETFLRAREEGKVNLLGFSAHSQEAALLAMEQFDFDTILFPINFVCWHQGGFGPEAVEMAASKDMGILAIKSMALTRIPEGQDRPYERLWYIPVEDDATARKAVKFTLSKQVTAAIPPGDPAFFRKALTFKDFTEPTATEQQDLQNLAVKTPPAVFSGLRRNRTGLQK